MWFLLFSLAQAQVCQPYLQAETQHSCGPQGYFIGFGYKYCYLFENYLRPDLTDQGQEWFQATQTCLLEELPHLQGSCDEMETQAFDSHGRCYRSHGFCDLPFLDRVKIMWTIREELKIPDRLARFLETAWSCWL